MTTKTEEKPTKKDWSHLLTISLNSSLIQGEQIDMAVNGVISKTGDKSFSKSNLICRCINEALPSILASKGLSEKEIEEILEF